MLFSQVEDRIKQMNNSCCAICQEEFINMSMASTVSTASTVSDDTTVSDIEVRQLLCGHLFHTSCVDTWLCEHDFHCPTCRAPCGIHKCDI